MAHNLHYDTNSPPKPMKKLLLLAASLAAITSMQATPVNVSGSNGESTLQTILTPYGVGDVNTTQVVSDSYWTASSLTSVLLVEIAGYAGDNSFGIYKQGDTSSKVQIFAGSASAPALSGTIAVPLGWTSFGFYLSNPNAGFTWYSDASLNAGGGLDHFVTYAGAAPLSYFIGIEDLNLGDYDYNDMVVSVQMQSQSVPDAGATAALLGLGFAAVAAFRRRMK